MRCITTSLLSALLLATVLAGSALAAGPTKVTEEIPPYTVSMALADYADFGAYVLDCGDFHVLATFEGSVTVIDFGDRMLRQVSYTGAFYNASDTSKSVERRGRTATWRVFDAAGNWLSIAIQGRSNVAVLPGGRHLTDAGILILDFSTDPPTVRLETGSSIDDELLCAALR